MGEKYATLWKYEDKMYNVRWETLGAKFERKKKQ